MQVRRGEDMSGSTPGHPDKPEELSFISCWVSLSSLWKVLELLQQKGRGFQKILLA